MLRKNQFFPFHALFGQHECTAFLCGRKSTNHRFLVSCQSCINLRSCAFPNGDQRDRRSLVGPQFGPQVFSCPCLYCRVEVVLDRNLEMSFRMTLGNAAIETWCVAYNSVVGREPTWPNGRLGKSPYAPPILCSQMPVTASDLDCRSPDIAPRPTIVSDKTLDEGPGLLADPV